MGKFGFGSKSGDADDDSNRSGLFGRKKSSQSNQNTQSDNPYAQNSANDPYAAPMTAYQKARADVMAPRPGAGLPSGPRAGVGGPVGGPPPPYSNQQSQQSTGYGSDKYGTSNGYGSNRYADNAAAFQANRQLPTNGSAWSGSSAATSSRGPGGYGGLGRTDSMNTTDEKRQDLFAGASERYAVRQTEQAKSSQNDYGASDGYGTSDGYGAQRELTAEEQEEEELSAIKQQIRQTREESLQSLDRSIMAGQQAEETMRSTMARLAVQGERLHNTERNLDIAATHNRRAEEKTRELKHLNRSMFAVKVNNPFTSKQRAEEQDLKKLEQHRADRSEREATRRAAYQTNQFNEESFRDLEQSQTKVLGFPKMDSAAGSKFAYIDGTSDDDQEEQDEQNVAKKEEILFGIATRLNSGSRVLGTQLEGHNVLIDRITEKSDAVDDHIRMNRTKLDRAVN